MVFVTGDTHIPIDIHKFTTRRFPEQQILSSDDFMVICGDFGGVWDGSNEEKYWQKWLNEKKFTTLFIDGNHENFHMLNEYPVSEKFGGKVHQLSDKIFHLMRGEIFTIDDRKIFCMGGASSHDKEYRIPNVSWWEEELPSTKEYENALTNLDKHDWTVDFVFTHCAPKKTQALMANWYENDPLTSFLQIVDDGLRYKKWYFGHYHRDEEVDVKHTALYQTIMQI